MKEKFLVISGITLLLLTSGCGGVIGSIEKYKFNFPKQKVEETIQIVLNEYPQMQKPDSIYGLSQSEFERERDRYCILWNKKTKYIVKFSFTGDSISWANSTKTVISLTSGAEYGETLFLASKISFWKKRKYSQLFEEQFISRLRQELKK